MMFCLSSGDLYLSSSFATVFKLFCDEVFEKSLTILLPIKSPVGSAILRIAVSEAGICASVADCLA